MKLIFAGSGSAFTVGQDNYHSNIILMADNGDKLLIDCGSDARVSLHALGFTHRDIKNVYISHLHADHAGGLEWLAFTSKFDPEYKGKPRLYICEALVDRLWNNVLSGGLGSLEEEVATLSSYFDIVPVPQNGSFAWQDINFQLFPTEHVYNGPNKVPSNGLSFKVGKTRCLITTDTRYTSSLKKAYQNADIIFQDCEINKEQSGVHTHYSQLVTLDPDIKARMWLYHYNACPLPDAKADGFCGFVRPGQVFELK